MRGRQPDLVAVAAVPLSRLAADDPLRQLAGQSLADRRVYVSRTRHAHRLIDIAAPRQRVAYRPAQAGGRPAERFYLGGMVVGLVLELQQPLLRLAVHVHIHADAASVVLLALLQVIQHAVRAQPPRAYCGDIHQADAPALTPKLPTHAEIHPVSPLHLLPDKRVLKLHAVQLCVESGMSAVVAPIGVQDAQLGLGRVTPLPLEIGDDLTQVIRAHRQPHPLAIRLQLLLRQGSQAVQHRHRPDLRLSRLRQTGEILGTALHRIDIVMPDPVQHIVRHIPAEYEQP